MQKYFNVLLVEDSANDAFLLEQALNEVVFIRFNLTWVEQLSQAVECLQRQLFDIILLDLNLPDSEGVDTLLQMRDRAASVPVVVFTGLQDASLGVRLIQEGAQDYLVKGELRGDILARSIHYAIERHRIEEELKQADRRKTEFLAMLAHELRNPLTPIRCAVEVLKQTPLDAPGFYQARDIMDRQLTQLTRLVNDLLDVSRITQGKVTVMREFLELSNVIQLAIEASQPLIESRRHKLSIALPQEPIGVEGDPLRLAQVFSNLLDNAAKYTADGGHISVSLATEDAEAVVRIKDNGMGISPAVLPYVFELFTQAERSLDRSQGGLGIGLTLVKQLLEMHGGRVEGISAGIMGQGSEFVVRLPLAEAPAQAAHSVDAARPGAGQPGGGVRVLVVDDNVDSAESLAMLLTLWGHDVRTAYEGASALVIAGDRWPDLILLDLGLPGMDGYEVARRLSDEHGATRPRLVAISGYGQPEDKLRSSAAGFDQHLVKPVNCEDLLAILNSARAKPAGVQAR